ncbi:MAG: recombinase RecJ, partial [Lachnospiraceae bacterium]|nr:recombinase RecJ [Lachnospiraceae bacterium]
DLMLEVDAVDTCLVYSVHPFGVKLSVRSCVREVKACEMAEFITQGIGSGGGHQEKAGGFIQMELLEKAFRSWGRDRDVKGFLKWRMDSYFDGIEVIHSAKYAASLEGMELYRKRRLPLGFVEAAEIFPVGTTICVRTLEGDLDVEVQENTFIMIGVKGEVYPSKREKFQHNYVVLEEPYEFQGEYAPAVRDLVEGRHISLIPHARACLATGESYIYVKELDHRVKVFTEWDDDKYMLGKEGDFLAVRQDDLHDIYVIEQSIFERTYEKAKMLKTG